MKIDNGFLKAALYVLGAFVILWVLPKLIAFLIGILGVTFNFLVGILPLILILAIYLSFTGKTLKEVYREMKEKFKKLKF